MAFRRVLDVFGVFILFLSSLKELISNWKADFLELKPKKKHIKVIFSTIMAVYNAVTVLRDIIAGKLIIYYPNDIMGVTIFGTAAVLGIIIGAIEDYYKRYSCSRPNFTVFLWACYIFVLPFPVFVFGEGVHRIKPYSPGTKGSGIFLVVLSVILSIIAIILIPFMNKLLLRISLLISVFVLPGALLHQFISERRVHFSWNMFSEMVYYLTFTYPILILSELFVLLLISKQRKPSSVDEKDGNT